MTELPVTVAGESLSGKRQLKDSNVENGRIRSRILVPLGLALLVLLATSVFSTHQLQRRRIDKEVRADLGQLEHLFELEVNKGGQLLNGLLDFIKEDHNLQEAWQAKDREALLDYSRPILILSAINTKFPIGFGPGDIDDAWLPVQDFLEKPIDFDVLTDKVETLAKH